MFISDELVFVELHKTAGSHIGRCLNDLLEGHQEGKHNIVPPELHDRFILGSIRNPWDWYVSLWAFGCDGKGSVHQQTTNRFSPSYYWRQLNKEMGRRWLTPFQYGKQILADAGKPLARWRDAYADSSDPECFRLWLRMILDPARRFDIREGFGFSPLSHHCGLLTYRYFKLFTSLGDDLFRLPQLGSAAELESIWAQRKITDFIIRNESLEEDLITGLLQAGVELTAEDRDYILQSKNQKTNTSSRRPAGFYHDRETIALIQEKEQFIIDQHQYEPPAAPTKAQ